MTFLKHAVPAVLGNTHVLSERIKKLRQERNWTQLELAEKLGVQQKQISTYERGVHFPSVDILIKMAEIFAVTLDHLAFESRGQSAPVKIQDRELLERFEQLDGFSQIEKNLAKEILDLVILKHKFHALTDARRP